jgi:hypothetical protein
MGSEGTTGLVTDVAASAVDVGGAIEGSNPALWLVVGVCLACALWGRRFARCR